MVGAWKQQTHGACHRTRNWAAGAVTLCSSLMVATTASAAASAARFQRVLWMTIWCTTRHHVVGPPVLGSWPVCSDADGACLQHVATMRSLHISIMAGTVSQAAGIPASLAQQGGSREG